MKTSCVRAIVGLSASLAMAFQWAAAASSVHRIELDPALLFAPMGSEPVPGGERHLLGVAASIKAENANVVLVGVPMSGADSPAVRAVNVRRAQVLRHRLVALGPPETLVYTERGSSWSGVTIEILSLDRPAGAP